MKKAIWITAAVMVVALICTACFGAALGSQGVRALLSQDWEQKAARWEQRIEAAENTVDVLDGGFTDADTDDMYKIGKEVAELPLHSDLYIHMDCGEVIVERGTGDKITATLEQFSWDAEETRRLVLTITNENTLSVSYPKEWRGIQAKLKVTVPQDMTALDITVGAGGLELKDITADVLSAAVNAGDISLERVLAKTATVHADLGEIEIDCDTQAEESLTVTNNCGDVELDIPRTAPFLMDFQVQTGTVQVDRETERLYNGKIQRAAAGGSGRLFRNGAGVDVKYHIMVTVKLGDLKIDEAD